MINKKLTISDIMDLCDVSRDTVIRWIDDNCLPAVKTGEGNARYLVNEEDLQKFLVSDFYYGHPEKINSNMFSRVPYVEDCWPMNLLYSVLLAHDHNIDIWEIDIRGFERMVNELTDREKRCIELRYQFGFSLSEVGAVYGGLSKERIRMILTRAEMKLYHRITKNFCQVVPQRDYNRVVAQYEALKAEYNKLKEKLSKYEEENEQDKTNVDFELVTIEELDLSVRSYNCLKRAGITNLADIIRYDGAQVPAPDSNAFPRPRVTNWLTIRNLGRKSLDEIAKKVFVYCGYHLRYCTTDGFKNIV